MERTGLNSVEGLRYVTQKAILTFIYCPTAMFTHV